MATVENHAYEAVYMYSEKNYADICQHFSWGSPVEVSLINWVTWFN